MIKKNLIESFTIVRICSDQSKVDIERADQKSIHVILRGPPSWKPDGSKGQTPPLLGGDPWRGIVKVINANIEEKMEKRRRAEDLTKAFWLTWDQERIKHPAEFSFVL